MKNALLIVGIGAIILAVGWWFLARQNTLTAKNPEPAPAEKKSVIDEQGAAIGNENLVTFQCKDGKSITAVFERDIAGLTLSDGRSVTLRQVESGSGIRYLSNDTKIEFRGQGSEGFLSEEGKTTYENCLASN